MANQFLNAQEYANVMLLLLKNKLVYGRLVDGQFKDQVTDENGLVINVKRPPRFIDKKDGTANLATQDLVVGTAPVAVDQYSKVHISVGDIEYISSFNQLMQNETMKSAASTLAHSVDLFVGSQTLKFASWVAGAAPGTGSSNSLDPTKNIASPQQAMAAHTRLMSQGVPNDSLCGVVTFNDGEQIRGGLQTNFTPGMNQTALQKTRIPIISEVDWYASQQVPKFTTGTRIAGNGTSTGFQVGGAAQNVNYRAVKGSAGVAGMTQTLNVTGATQAGLTVVAGEVFQIAGVFAWDWRANQITDHLQQFTVLTGGTAAGGTGNLALVISPAIIVPGTNDGVSTDANTAFATVSAVPGNNAFIQFAGAPSTVLTNRAAWHKRAISLVSARLIMPFTGVASQAVDEDTGISIRYWRGSDISTGQHIHRWDMMYGAAVMDQFLGTRVSGS